MRREVLERAPDGSEAVVVYFPYPEEVREAAAAPAEHELRAAEVAESLALSVVD